MAMDHQTPQNALDSALAPQTTTPTSHYISKVRCKSRLKPGVPCLLQSIGRKPFPVGTHGPHARITEPKVTIR